MSWSYTLSKFTFMSEKHSNPERKTNLTWSHTWTVFFPPMQCYHHQSFYLQFSQSPNDGEGSRRHHSSVTIGKVQSYILDSRKREKAHTLLKFSTIFVHVEHKALTSFVLPDPKIKNKIKQRRRLTVSESSIFPATWLFSIKPQTSYF